MDIDGVFNFLDNRLYSDIQIAHSVTDKSGYAYSFESIYDINRLWSVSIDFENIDEDFDKEKSITKAMDEFLGDDLEYKEIENSEVLLENE